MSGVGQDIGLDTLLQWYGILYLVYGMALDLEGPFEEGIVLDAASHVRVQVAHKLVELVLGKKCKTMIEGVQIVFEGM